MPIAAHRPDELLAGPFRGSTAVAAGILTRGQLRSSAWRRLFRDVYVASTLPVGGRTRLAALRLVVPSDVVIRGRTAAWLYGAWQPAPGAAVPVEIARARLAYGNSGGGLGGGPGRAGTATRRLVTAQRAYPLLEDIVEMDGLRVLSPHRTCFELMRQRGLVEAVVVADAFAYAAALRLPEFAAYVAAHPRWPGVRAVRVALGLAAAAAASPGETRLRLVVVLAGLPEPLVNVPVYCKDVLIAVPDLLVLGLVWVGLEYQGAYHWEAAGQPQRDDLRQNRFTAHTGIPLRYHDASVRADPPRVLAEVVRLSGAPARRPLDPWDFRRPPAALAW